MLQYYGVIRFEGIETHFNSAFNVSFRHSGSRSVSLLELTHVVFIG